MSKVCDTSTSTATRQSLKTMVHISKHQFQKLTTLPKVGTTKFQVRQVRLQNIMEVAELSFIETVAVATSSYHDQSTSH